MNTKIIVQSIAVKILAASLLLSLTLSGSEIDREAKTFCDNEEIKSFLTKAFDDKAIKIFLEMNKISSQEEVDKYLASIKPEEINRRHGRGEETFLAIAAMLGKPQLLTGLLNMNSDPNQTDKFGNKPIDFGVRASRGGSLLYLLRKLDEEGALSSSSPSRDQGN